MNKLFAILLVALSGAVYAEQPSNNGFYNYNFPLNHATPFDVWNTNNASMKPEDKAAAEFGAEFAGKMMTIVTRVEDTKTGKKVYVIVANQNCLIDIAPHEGKLLASAVKCSTKPFGKF